MAEIMEEDKVTIKEEISIVEDTYTVYVVGEDVKEESTENQGICKHFIYIYSNAEMEKLDIIFYIKDQMKVLRVLM